MAVPRQDMDSAASDAELHGSKGGDKQAAEEERASSASSQSSSSSSSSELSDDGARQPTAAAAAGSTTTAPQQPATPPPTQLIMGRDLSLDYCGGGDAAADEGRIPAAVFERDASDDPTKDWSMMSTESVFGLQVAPSNDFTGFFLAHPELMDIATPPRASTVDAAAAAEANKPAAAPVLSLHFDSIPELPDNTMKGNYSFAFPNLIEDKRNCSKKVEQEEQPPEAAAPADAAMAAPMPVQAEVRAEAQLVASSKTEAAPEPVAAKGGLFSCLPCC